MAVLPAEVPWAMSSTSKLKDDIGTHGGRVVQPHLGDQMSHAGSTALNRPALLHVTRSMVVSATARIHG
jgi:hypothetical protein